MLYTAFNIQRVKKAFFQQSEKECKKFLFQIAQRPLLHHVMLWHACMCQRPSYKPAGQIEAVEGLYLTASYVIKSLRKRSTKPESVRQTLGVGTVGGALVYFRYRIRLGLFSGLPNTPRAPAHMLFVTTSSNYLC